VIRSALALVANAASFRALQRALPMLKTRAFTTVLRLMVTGPL
jgi:hypothetical protein